MRKKCIAIAKKAMVWTLAAAMLVTTPLTASAAGLRGVYSVDEGLDANNKSGSGSGSGSNTNSGGAENPGPGPNPNPPGGDSGSGSGSGSHSLDDLPDGLIKGFTLDRYEVSMKMEGAYDAESPVTETLTATLSLDGTLASTLKDEQKEALKEAFNWASSDESVVTWSRGKETKNEEFTLLTETVTLTAKAGGNTDVTASINADSRLFSEEVSAEATANVFVKQYASSIGLNPAEKYYVKHTLDLSSIVVRDPETANDDIVFMIDSSSPKGVATLKDNMLTFKKVGKVKITAVSEMGKRADAELNVEAGTPITSIEIINANSTDAQISKKKVALDVSKTEEQSLDVKVKAYVGKGSAKKEVADFEKDTTDFITWTSKKPGIVAVGDAEGYETTLIPVGVGKAQIIAQATSGKKATLTVTVNASLTGLEIVNIEEGQKFYSGQTLQVEVRKLAGSSEIQSNEKVSWSIDKVNNKANKNAKINGKGFLTVQNIVTRGDEVTVTVKAAKSKDENGELYSDRKTFTVDQSNVSTITVSDESGVIAQFDVNNKTNNKSKTVREIPVEENREYTISATGNGDCTDDIALASLTATSAKTKVATVSRNAADLAVFSVSKGTSKVTLSGVNLNNKGKAKKISAVFTVKATQPATSLTMNKTDVTVKATGKKQTVKFSVKANKGSTTNTKKLNWTVLKIVDNNPVERNDLIKNGTFTLPKNGYDPGDRYVVTANAEDGSEAVATATVNVVTPSTAVKIYESWDGSTSKDPQEFARKKHVLSVGDPMELSSAVNVGTTRKPAWYAGELKNRLLEDGKVVAAVTYTANKKDIVHVVENKVYAIKKGTAKVTARTADGKTSVLTITVN